MAPRTRTWETSFYGAALSFRLRGDSEAHHHAPGTAPHAHDDAQGPIVDLIIELNGEWQARQDIAGAEDPHSGGNVIWLSPGVSITAAGGRVGYLSAGVPIVRNLNGAHPEPRFRVTAGVSRAF